MEFLYSYYKLSLSRILIYKRTKCRNLADLNMDELLSYIIKLIPEISTAEDSTHCTQEIKS
jgi:hypothetical protein